MAWSALRVFVVVRRRRFSAPFVALAVSAVGCGGAERGATPSVVAQMDHPSSFGPSRLIVDQGELFWNDDQGVYRVSTDGGTPSVFHENVCGPLYGFTLDADSLYMGTCGGDPPGSVRTLSAFGRKSGQETVLDTGDFALDVAKTSDGFAYVSCDDPDGGVHLLGATGGPRETISTGFCTYGVTAVGDQLVVLGEGPVVVVVDLLTTQVVPLGALNVLGADTEHVFVARNTGSNGTEIRALDPRDASLTPVIDREPTPCGIAASDGRNLYFAVTGSDTEHCTILSAPVAGGSAWVLAKDRSTVASIATDGNFVYWLEQEQSASANVARVMKQRL
jgi:hypothetical protein